jgi:hypothetical protein
MSTTDYVIDILLILVIFRQVRPHELSPRAALLPLALLILAGIVYLRPFTLRGNDLILIVILAAAGDVRPLPPLGVQAPGSRQVEPEVEQGMRPAGDVGGEHDGLAVLRLTGDPGMLPGHARGR